MLCFTVMGVFPVNTQIWVLNGKSIVSGLARKLGPSVEKWKWFCLVKDGRIVQNRKIRSVILNIAETGKLSLSLLTSCGPVMPYDGEDLCQHWLR